MRNITKPYLYEVLISFEEQQEAMEGFKQRRDMVRFMFLEVPLGFWVWNGLQGSILQEKSRRHERGVEVGGRAWV